MLIQEFKECRDALATFRKKRNRCRDFTYGRQWNDLIEADGRKITEYEYILSEGNVPLKNNLIRRIVRNVLGVFRGQLPEILKEEYPGELSQVVVNNGLEELYSRSMEEFLISGMVVHRKRYACQTPGFTGYGPADILTDFVSPDSFFFNTDSRDIRGWDLNIVGQVHKVDFNDWCKAFVKTRTDYRKAKDLFNMPHNKINVIEMWKREMSPRFIYHDRRLGCVRRVSEKEARQLTEKGVACKWQMLEMWRYYFFTEDGTVLLEGDSPYPRGSHPFVMKCYPFLDGEIQSFVADMIDQQKYTNRLITLYDWVIRASAKGVLLVPEGAVEPQNLQAMADQWGRFNGVIVYKADPVLPEPKQISGNLANLGISELLEIQLKMLEDVSGVNGILQGNTSGSNVSGALYDSQTTNAMYSLADLLETYRAFIHDCAEKDALFGRR